MGELGDLGFATQHKVRHRHGRSMIVVVLALAIILGGGYLVVTRGSDYLHGALQTEDYPGPGTGTIEIVIPDGASLSQMGEVLAAAGVVKSAQAFRNAARDNAEATSIQPGRYTLKKEMSGKGALVALLDPKSKVIDRLTIPEGWTAREIYRAWSKRTGISVASFRKAARDPQALGLPDYAHGVEGYLFPASYDVPAEPDAHTILTMMAKRYLDEAKDLGIVDAAHRLGFDDPADVVVLASLAQSEVRRDQDMPLVSRVVLNRLHTGMKLQFDSTLKYLYPGDTSVLLNNGQIDNPSRYNTYKYKGLPPGPIANPGAAALQAAVHPAKGNWLYFVTVNPDTGETRFTASDQQWEKWRQQLVNGWCKRHSGKC